MHVELSSQAQTFWATLAQVHVGLFIALVVELGAIVRRILAREASTFERTLRRTAAATMLVFALLAAILVFSGTTTALSLLSGGVDSPSIRARMVQQTIIAGALILAISLAQFQPLLAGSLVARVDRGFRLFRLWRLRRRVRARL